MENNRRKFLKHLASIGGAASLSGVNALSHAASHKARVQDIRLSKNNGYVRLVFDLDSSVKHSVFTLHEPERGLVVMARVLNQRHPEEFAVHRADVGETKP